jgi:uncharacterized membrane protein
MMFHRRTAHPTYPRMTRDRRVAILCAPLLIVAGAAIYEASFAYAMHPVVFWSGVYVTLLGLGWLASDWLGL